MDLKDEIENIFQKKNDIFELLKGQENKIEEMKNKEKKDKKDKKNKKDVKEKFENTYYLTLIYYYLTIHDIDKASQIIKELYDNEKSLLFEILKKYSYILQKFNIIEKDLLNELLSDTNNFENIKNIFKYNSDVLTILFIIDNNKDNIIKNINEKKDKINITEFIKQNNNDKIEEICKIINNLIIFIKQKNFLFIEFNIDFWNYYLNRFNKTDIDCINKLILLRNALFNYQSLFKSQFKDKNKINDYCSRDDYATNIHNKIVSLLKDNQFSNIEILNIIFVKDPYYSDESKKRDRDINILKYIKFNKDYKKYNRDDDKFFEKFQALKLYHIFESKLSDFFKYIFNLVNTIYDFELLYKLFNSEKLSDKALKEYIKRLIDKFKEINLTFNKNVNEDYKEIIKLLVLLIDIIYRKQTNTLLAFFTILEQKCQNYIYDIFIEFLNTNENIKDEKILNHIFSIFKNSNNYIDYSIRLLTNIKDEKKKKKYFECLKEFIFEFDEFFNNKKYKEIHFYISLKDKKLLDKKSEFYIQINKTLESIKNKGYNIKKFNFESLLSLDENEILERLKLINDNPKEFLNTIKTKLKEINDEIKNIKSIKDLLSIFHPKFVKNNKSIDNIISSLENKNLNEIDNKKNEIIELTNKHKDTIEKTLKVKNSLFFDMLYKEEKNKDNEDNEFEIFDNAIENLNQQENIIKEPEEINNDMLKKFLSLFDNDDKLRNEIQILTKYFNIDIDFEQIEDKIKVLLNKENYIKEINNILFFLEKIKKDKETELSLKLKEIIDIIKSVDKKNNKYKTIKECLQYLKENNIYNYVGKNEHLNIFRAFYENELAIVFLLNKDPENAKHLGERLNPFETTLTNADIISFQFCLEFMQKLNIENSSDKDIFYNIKKYIEEDVSILKHFENYANNYRSLKELDLNFDEKNSVFQNVEENVNSGVYYFYKCYDEYKKNGKLEENGYDYLYKLKCKITTNSNEKDEKLIEKNNKLKYFDNLVNKISTLKYYINNLREKGSQIDLYIEVHFCYDKNKKDGKYILGANEKTFKEINKYLINVNKYYMKLLTKSYLTDEYIRFTYGKQFNFIFNYLKAKNNDNSFANYFLNNIPKKELNREFPEETGDSIQYYKIYYENTITNISNYIKKYFIDNYGKLENFYNNYKIKPSTKKNMQYKGINYMNSQKSSIEEEIIDLFIELTGKFPISQNIILINKDTSFEEIESFLYRSILCNYHTLFIIGITDISPKQEDYLMKNTNYLIKYIKERDNPNIKNKRKIEADIKPCIIFIYNTLINEKQNQNKFIEQIKKMAAHKDLTRKKEKKDIDKVKEKDKKKQLKINDIKFDERKPSNGDISIKLTTKENFERIKNDVKIENVTVYMSDVNGTGKSWAIKDDIKANNFEYVYFPFGGFLTKEIVYNSIKDLLKEIDEKYEEDKEKVCIHLDLYETEQKSIMNDFLLSFLFTKYYKNDENVIYIPKEMNIYVEIPNCFCNFIETYPILKIFKNEQLKIINLNNQRNLKLTEKEKGLFGLLNISNYEEFIDKNIHIENPSYYQKRQFINCILSQINEDNYDKLNDDTLNKIINSTIHFTQNCFSPLLKEKNEKGMNEDEMLQKLSDIYKSEFDNKEKIDKKNKSELDKSNKDNPLIFYNNEKQKFIEVSMSLDEYKNKKYERKDYLSKIKEIFNLENPIDENEKENGSDLKSLDTILGEKYVITPDNFIKMVKIYYRYISNINLILMGETGCGKTLLIFKIYQLLNNGEEIKDYKLNIHGGFTDEDIIKEIKKLNN